MLLWSPRARLTEHSKHAAQDPRWKGISLEPSQSDCARYQCRDGDSMRWLPVTLGIILIAASASHAVAEQPAQNSKPVTPADEISQPTLIRRVRPVYPPIAAAAKTQGVVVVKATVDQFGKVRVAEILRSPSDLLSEAALTAVRQWEYRPATVKGVPISAPVTVEIPFYSSDKTALLPLPKPPKK